MGGGQAGLAMGYYLREQGRRFAIFERGDSIAPAWRERWDSLTLFTPRRYSALPGLPFPGDPDGYPTRDEVIAYLERYAETFELPIELNSDVRRLSHEGGRFVLEVDGRTVTADQVVVATGPFQTPFVPKLAREARPGRLAGPQHRLPAAGRRARRNRARGRGREHRLPDRQGALGHAQGHPLGRLEAEAACRSASPAAISSGG